MEILPLAALTAGNAVRFSSSNCNAGEFVRDLANKAVIRAFQGA